VEHSGHALQEGPVANVAKKVFHASSCQQFSMKRRQPIIFTSKLLQLHHCTHRCSLFPTDTGSIGAPPIVLLSCRWLVEAQPRYMLKWTIFVSVQGTSTETRSTTRLRHRTCVCSRTSGSWLYQTFRLSCGSSGILSNRFRRVSRRSTPIVVHQHEAKNLKSISIWLLAMTKIAFQVCLEYGREYQRYSTRDRPICLHDSYPAVERAAAEFATEVGISIHNYEWSLSSFVVD
jgi:hypothetical protein